MDEEIKTGASEEIETEGVVSEGSGAEEGLEEQEAL